MPLKISNIQTPVEQPEVELVRVIARKLKLPQDEIASFQILRKSLDARSRMKLRFVYTVAVQLKNEADCSNLISKNSQLQVYTENVFDDPEPGSLPMEDRPVIVGTGPAGMLAGYYLALKGYQPILIERGQPVKERVNAVRRFDSGLPFEPENNYLFGEGGAGCFSDGKLTCRISGPDVDWVLNSFVECGGRESIRYEHRPHLGSNKLPMICRNFRRKTEEAGAEYRFNCQLEGIDLSEGQFRGIQTSSGYLRTSHLVLGIGHSARDTYQMLYEAGVPMQSKDFQLGLRIEQPQEQVNQHKYGKSEYFEILGAADYTLVAHGNRDLFTFCMCAGGWIIPSISEANMFCSNGMSNSRHETPFANSGLVVTLKTDELNSSHPLAGVELQRKYESLAFELAGRNYYCPIQKASDFLAGRTPDPNSKIHSSYKRGVTPLELSQLLPPAISKTLREGLPIMDQKWKGDFLKNASLVGPEMRGSSPVRMERDRLSFQSPSINGLYPVGEGAGYAGGIMTAAVDGLRASREIVRMYSPLQQAR